MYKQWITGCLAGCLLFSMVTVAYANVGDNTKQMETRYGEYRYVEDKAGNTWSKSDWEAGGSRSQKAKYYVYGTKVKDRIINIYAVLDDKGFVSSEKYELPFTIQVRDFKNYFPEMYKQLVSDKALAFGTGFQVRSWLTDNPPTTLGVVVPLNKDQYTYWRFDVYNSLKEIENASEINPLTIINGMTISRVDYYTVQHRLELPLNVIEGRTGEEAWFQIDNPFK